MEQLRDIDVEEYLMCGVLTEPFLEDDYVLDKVNFDYKIKVLTKPQYTKIESLYHWINHNIKFSKDKEYIDKNKFQRTAKEIWESGFAVGCSDYAILFATFSRQLGFPTTILATAEFDWLTRFRNGDNCKNHVGHYFCECFYENEWVLVDPTNCMIERSYFLDELNLSYNIHGGNKFIPYLRCVDLGKKQTIEEHNLEMDSICGNF